MTQFIMKTNFEKYNSEAVELFNQIRTALQNSDDPALKSKASQVPTCLSSKDKKINVVFAGQYGAGKSSLLTILTGKKLAVGGGITTTDCQTFEWLPGVNVTDTPGIHTQNRPDHDAITYAQLAKADLVVFVVTNEGFSNHLANHFIKLINEKGKGHEMMLVVNKMDRTADGNTLKQQKVLIDKNITPVIAPYTADDMYTSFVSTEFYNQASEPGYETYREQLVDMSGMNTFLGNIDKFINDKGVLGRHTTSLYEAEKILSDIVGNMKTGDAIVDGTMHMLNENRRLLTDARLRIKQRAATAIHSGANDVQNWGNDVASSFGSAKDQDDIKHLLKEKETAVERRSEKLTSDIEQIINAERDSLKNQFDNLSKREFVHDLKMAMEERLKNVNISAKTVRNVEKVGNRMRDIGTTVAKMAVGPNATGGIASIFKTSSYAGSKLHDVVLKFGHLAGHKFAPWQAVRWTKNIANGSRLLGAFGSFLGVGMQIYNDKQEDKMKQQLKECRENIRTCFSDVANTIDLEYNKATDTWIQENIDTHVAEIDSSIKEINDGIETNNALYDKLSGLLSRVRCMIKEIQTAR